MSKKSQNFLDVVPIHHKSCSFHINDESLVVIDIEHKGFYNIIAQKIFKKPRFSHITLDEFGTFVYNSIDGKHTIYDISILVHAKFGEKAEPLIERLVQYIHILRNNNFIDYAKKV